MAYEVTSDNEFVTPWETEEERDQRVGRSKKCGTSDTGTPDQRAPQTS
jgi:hypothetical protein